MIGRRSFAASLVGLAIAGCSRRERSALGAPEEPPKPLPPMPVVDAGAPLPRGRVGTQTWSFDGNGRAVVVVPSWGKASDRYPVLVALHGRGEAQRGPDRGVLGWPRDYELLRAIERVCAPPLTTTDFEGFVETKHLSETNRALVERPFGGLVVVCPYVPDIDLKKPALMHDYGRYLCESVLPRVRRELPVLAAPASTGIDGVSLGGAVALRVGLGHAEAFGAVGTLQAAIGGEQIPEIVDLAKSARAKRPDLRFRLLTSKDDYFHDVLVRASNALRSANVAHDFVDVPGPHDYPFNRGPGAIEMLLFHDRVLSRA